MYTCSCECTMQISVYLQIEKRKEGKREETGEEDWSYILRQVIIISSPSHVNKMTVVRHWWYP